MLFWKVRPGAHGLWSLYHHPCPLGWAARPRGPAPAPGALCRLVQAACPPGSGAGLQEGGGCGGPARDGMLGGRKPPEQVWGAGSRSPGLGSRSHQALGLEGGESVRGSLEPWTVTALGQTLPLSGTGFLTSDRRGVSVWQSPLQPWRSEMRWRVPTTSRIVTSRGKPSSSTPEKHQVATPIPLPLPPPREEEARGYHCSDLPDRSSGGSPQCGV